MKKLLALLMMVIIGIIFCACGAKPSKEELIVEANRLVAKQEVSNEGFDIYREFDEDYDAYCVVVSLDEDFWCTTYSADSPEGRLILQLAEGQCEETIDNLVESLFNDIKELFADFDVDVMVGYEDKDGEYTNIHSTVE